MPLKWKQRQPTTRPRTSLLSTPSAKKYWITNGAIHAHFCIVFAHLMMDGKNEGLHTFLVPIRSKNMKPKKGVTIWDMGHKIGVNGVDNASLSFDNVRIPRENLLDAMSTVSESGEFSSEGYRKHFWVGISLVGVSASRPCVEVQKSPHDGHSLCIAGRRDGRQNTPLFSN